MSGSTIPGIYTIYQNHPLNSMTDVSVFWVTMTNDGSSFTPSDEASCNATIYSVMDITNRKRYLVCELHLDDIGVHGTVTVFNRKSARTITKELLLEGVQQFITRTISDREMLGLS